MAYETTSLDATIAAAAGADPALLRELRSAFAESVERQLDLLQRSRCDANWVVAANRLRGIAASFHAEELMILAQEAVEAAPGEPSVKRRIGLYCEQFRNAGPDPAS